MTITHAVAGFGGILGPLDHVLPAGSVLVIEEPELIAARGLRDRLGDHPCVGMLVPGHIHAEDDAAGLIEAAERPASLRAVIPANEYGVVAAARLAQAWRVPGAGVQAALAFRDKARLRSAAAGHGIAQPRWQLAAAPGAVAEFRDRAGGECVLKPANRQASLGVSLIGPDDSVHAAWQHAASVDESSMRTGHMPQPRMLVEQRVHGPEVSVEALVSAGRVVFQNVTAKLVQAGPCPVEIGQSVPAQLPPEVVFALSEAVRLLVRATGYGSGVLHAEWILADGGPYLVECAARMPGDNIKDLIDLAYGGDLIADYVRVLEGADPGRPPDPKRGVAIRFLGQESGVVAEVTGTDRVAAMAGVQEVIVTAGAGGRIQVPSSSWQRAGHVMVTGSGGAHAAALADDLARQIRIVTREDQ